MHLEVFEVPVSDQMHSVVSLNLAFLKLVRSRHLVLLHWQNSQAGAIADRLVAVVLVEMLIA